MLRGPYQNPFPFGGRTLNLSLLFNFTSQPDALSLSTNSVRNFQPTLFFDFTEAEMIADTGKLGLISFHTSQVERYQGSNQDLHEDMHALAAYNGFLFKTPKRYAEGFVPWKIALERSPSRRIGDA